jgi:hypothetical protein
LSRRDAEDVIHLTDTERLPHQHDRAECQRLRHRRVIRKTGHEDDERAGVRSPDRAKDFCA